jgi:hypothetical protein
MNGRNCALAICYWLLAAAVGRGATPPAAVSFIQSHCTDCHDSDAKKGGLDLTSLPFDLQNAATFDEWVKIHDRVRDGEMPPKTETRPAAADLNKFLDTISKPMVQADQAQELVTGRAVWRRLNRYEYENTLRDLLSSPWLQVKDMLPEDGESHRFNKDGAALSVSHVQMSAYLTAADFALRQAAATQVAEPADKTVRYYARQQGSFIGPMKFGPFGSSPERATFPMLGTQAQTDVIDGTAPLTVGAKDPATRDREAFGVVASSYEPIELRFDSFVARHSGHYKLRFSGYTFWAAPLTEKKWWIPDRSKLSRGHRDEPVTIYAETPPRQLRWLGTFDVSADPSVHEIDVDLVAGEKISPDASRFFRSRAPNWHNPLATKEGTPGVAFQWMEVQGPIYDQWPAAGHRLLFGDLPIKNPSQTGENVEVISQQPADANRLLRSFMQKAYRRPVDGSEVDRFKSVINYALKSGDDFTDSMIAGYSAVLCSPDFLCLNERPGRLDDYALASRLSFFLWNSPPDPELRHLADTNTLHSPTVLASQVQRMLNDPKSRRFEDAFLDYWIDLRKMLATSPDATLYPDYYLDDLLAESAEQETRLFFDDLNERLAKLYQIPDVAGVAMRRVELPPDSLRGGLMTQASVLKVTANGTTTSPVVRGAWIMERILGKPPRPPPPNVPSIEPDTRGATTIRAQLEQHRKNASCASCHAKIDPAGFALENFDVMGGWRAAYRALGDGTPVVGYGHNGQPFTFHNGQPVDSSGVLPDGRSFKDVRGLKALLLADQRQIARNMVEQLITYSTGAPVRFGDRPEVEAILDRASKSEYGMRTLISQVVQSAVFQMK